MQKFDYCGLAYVWNIIDIVLYRLGEIFLSVCSGVKQSKSK